MCGRREKEGEVEGGWVGGINGGEGGGGREGSNKEGEGSGLHGSLVIMSMMGATLLHTDKLS